MSALPVEALQRLATEAGVLKLMSENEERAVTLEVVEPRAEIIVSTIGAIPATLECPPPRVHHLVYQLEDQVFGGETYVAVTCNGVVIREPFKFISWEYLVRGGW